jgi:hypothetical protein
MRIILESSWKLAKRVLNIKCGVVHIVVADQATLTPT